MREDEGNWKRINTLYFSFFYSFSLLVNRNLSSVWTIAGIILSVLAFLSFSIHACYYSSLNISSSALLWLVNYSLDIFFFSDM